MADRCEQREGAIVAPRHDRSKRRAFRRSARNGIAPSRSALTVSQRAAKNVRATVATRTRSCTRHRGPPSREALYRKVFTSRGAVGNRRPARPLRRSAPTGASRTARDASHRGQHFAGETGTVSASAFLGHAPGESGGANGLDGNYRARRDSVRSGEGAPAQGGQRRRASVGGFRVFRRRRARARSVCVLNRDRCWQQYCTISIASVFLCSDHHTHAECRTID
jgi:hypothetical protein